MGVMIVFLGVFLLTPHKRRDPEGFSEQALITDDGTPATLDEQDMDASGRSSRSVVSGVGSDVGSSVRRHAFSNCGLSAVDESERGSVSMERLLSLTYMPVVLNDASVAFYMDRALISNAANRGHVKPFSTTTGQVRSGNADVYSINGSTHTRDEGGKGKGKRGNALAPGSVSASMHSVSNVLASTSNPMLVPVTTTTRNK